MKKAKNEKRLHKIEEAKKEMKEQINEEDIMKGVNTADYG